MWSLDLHKQIHEKETVLGKPFGWIQWKGTNVCVDLHCICGYQGHVDVDFFYAYQCVKCGAKYAVGAYIQLIPLTEEESLHFDEYERDYDPLEDMP